MWNPQTHGTSGTWDGGDEHSAGQSIGKRTRTQDLLHHKQHSATTNLQQGSNIRNANATHADPYALHFGSIDFLGVMLSGNSSAADFRSVEHKLGTAKVTQFRAAADKGPDALLTIFLAHGVVVDDHNRADVLAVADAYIRYADDARLELTDHGKLGQSDGYAEGTPTGKSGGDRTLGELAGQVGGWGMSVELGHFYDVELGVHIPTEVPGLFVDLGGKLGFTKKADGTQELEIELGTGVTFEAFDFLKVSKRNFINLKLVAGKGESFADAFEDAIKQSIRAVLIDSGVEQQLFEVKRMAVEGTSTADWMNAFGHAVTTLWSGKLEVAERAIASLAPNEVIALVDAYQAFFRDNIGTGFDISIHKETSVELEGEGFGGGLDLDMGIGASEGKDDPEAHLYAELGARATLDLGEHGPTVSLFGNAHFDHTGPHFTVGFEVELPWDGTDLFAAASLLALNPGFREGLGGLVEDGSGDTDGWTAALNLFGEALRESVMFSFAKLFGLAHTMSLSVSYTFGLGGIESVKATAKSKTSDKLDLEVFDATASMGTFLDVSASYTEAAPKAPKSLAR